MCKTEEVYCDVFLGGSCCKTTWRQDLAIPYLEKHGVTYYNPQVKPGEWIAGMGNISLFIYVNLFYMNAGIRQRVLTMP